MTSKSSNPPRATESELVGAARYDWDAKAAFMKRVGAIHAEWECIVDDEGCARMVLTKLVMAPAPAAPVVRPPGPAARLMAAHHGTPISDAEKAHNTMFASSRVKPKFMAPEPPPAAVPRAVRAKQEAERGSRANRR